MMKRLCFLSPNLSHAHRVVGDLREAGIPEKHIYVVVKSEVADQPDLPLEGLPDEGPEGDDFLAGYERGLAFGGAAGLFAGILMVTFPPAGLALGGGAILLMELAGAGVGGLLSGIAGASFHSSRLKQFESALAEGKILILVDVPQQDVGRVEALIHAHDPAVVIEGVEPPAPIIPR
jgi:hypothetical protein